jgi:hypothetical protein
MRLLSTTEIETGTSFAFSSRWVAVTTTSEIPSLAAGVSSGAAAAHAAGSGIPTSNEKVKVRSRAPEQLQGLIPAPCPVGWRLPSKIAPDDFVICSAPWVFSRPYVWLRSYTQYTRGAGAMQEICDGPPLQRTRQTLGNRLPLPLTHSATWFFEVSRRARPRSSGHDGHAPTGHPVGTPQRRCVNDPHRVDAPCPNAGRGTRAGR